MDIQRFFNQKPPKLAGEGSSDVTLGESTGCRSSQDSDSTPDSGNVTEASRSSEKHPAAACRSRRGCTWGGAARAAPPTMLLIG